MKKYHRRCNLHSAQDTETENTLKDKISSNVRARAKDEIHLDHVTKRWWPYVTRCELSYKKNRKKKKKENDTFKFAH